VVDLCSNGTNLITQIENSDPETWTPLAESLYEATRYFKATESAYNGGTYSGKDPISYPCQKNFVLILTDGESTKDQNIPGTRWSLDGQVSDPDGFSVKTYMDRIAALEGYDSQWGVNANTSDGTYYLEGVSYYAHTTDLRTSTVGKSDLPGKQNLTIYTVFAFDDSPIGRDILKKAAKYGGSRISITPAGPKRPPNGTKTATECPIPFMRQRKARRSRRNWKRRCSTSLHAYRPGRRPPS
jgi:type IV pilus assembly protein PilY1